MKIIIKMILLQTLISNYNNNNNNNNIKNIKKGLPLMQTMNSFLTLFNLCKPQRTENKQWRFDIKSTRHKITKQGGDYLQALSSYNFFFMFRVKPCVVKISEN